MRAISNFGRSAAAALVMACSVPGATVAKPDCADVLSDPTRLGVGRVVEVDTARGPVFGTLTKLPHEAPFLAPKEVVLTFDDGPLPWISRAILDALDRHCTRATFFSVGKMALAYPSVIREEMDRGHTVGTHTWSHPLNLKRLKLDAATAEIERGFAAVSAAAGQPVAPFFRFPGLSDSPSMVAHLEERHVGTFTVDVVSNDSFIHDPARLTRETLAKVDANHGGIILFHDIKPATAKALPAILDALAARGYSVVHIMPKVPVAPKPDLVAGFEPQVARLIAQKTQGTAPLMPFFGTTGPQRATGITHEEKPDSATVHAPPADEARENQPAAAEPTKPRIKRTSLRRIDGTGSAWSTSIRRTPREP